MSTVALSAGGVHGSLAAPLRGQLPANSRVLLLSILFLTGLAIVQALRAAGSALAASVAASLLLLRPIIALARLLLLVIILIVVFLAAATTSGGDSPAGPQPTGTATPSGIPSAGPLAPARPGR